MCVKSKKITIFATDLRKTTNNEFVKEFFW